jgi:O-antigen/teichoic acid export membrane protein
LNGATLAFNFLVVLLLSRLLGPEGYGAYAFAIAWALLLAVPAMLGLSQLVVREIAIYRVRADWSRVRGLLRWANRAVLAASLVISLTAAAAFAVLDWPASGLFEPTLVGLALIPLVTLVAIRQSAMQGFGAVVLARVPEALAVPTLMIAFVLVLEAGLADGISAGTAAGSQVLAAACAALLGMYLLRRTVPREVPGAQPRYETRVWIVGALPILVASGIQAVNVQTGTILTGSIAGAEEAGIYSVSTRIAVLLSFLLLAAVPSLMPAIAELNEKAESDALQRLLKRASQLLFFGSLPLVIGAIVFAGPLLELFGGDFGTGVDALRILCIGQLVQIGTGLAGTVLIMIGEAGQATAAVAAGTVVNLLLSAALIPAFGVEGAAVGTAASVAFTNSLMAYLLWRRRRISAIPLRLRRTRS